MRDQFPFVRFVALIAFAMIWLGVIHDLPASAADEPLVQSFLAKGKLADGAAALQKQIKGSPDDEQARFSLGVVQFLQAVERFGQAQYKYGLLQHRARALPLLRLPVPVNENPAEIAYEDARDVVSKLLADLETAEATLADVDSTNVKLPLHFGRIKLDLDGDGEASDVETFWRIFAMFNPAVDAKQGESFRIAFDGGDVHWLRGYCHLLMSLCEAALAHDWRELFERTGHMLYPRVKSPHAFLKDEELTEAAWWWDFRTIADMVAAIHLINFPVKEPERMRNSLKHLHAVIAQSRASWTRILTETDNDDEWLPSPDQTGVIPGVRIQKDMIDSWHGFLDEGEALLRGQKLIPFWRGYKDKVEEVFAQRRGVNLKRVFTEPKDFDLVMWVSGTGATPYLENGELTDQRTWTGLMRTFGGGFFGFALWFN